MHQIRIPALLLFALATAVARALPPSVPEAALRYVDEAFTRNLALQANALDVEQARARLAEARGAYQPSLDFVARYSFADGGRTIDLPTGDLLNGAYRTLNDFLRSQGQNPAFPQISNQSIALLRNHEQETKLRLTQPIYRPEIASGVRANRATTASREAQLAAYRRELRLMVLTAYHNYLQSEAALEILDSAAGLTAEALRTNRLLAGADKVTEDRVLRAEADDLAVQQQCAEAKRDRNHARGYFNFLLNLPLETPIVRASEEELRSLADALLADAAPDTLTVNQREELQALQSAINAAAAGESAVRSRLYPTIGLAVDAGVQGSQYRTGAGANFVQGSLVAEVNLWDGRQRRSRIEQARISRRAVELQLDSTRQQLGLQLQHTFLDTRNEFTRATLNRAITRQRLFIAAAVLDRAAALTPLP
jgi:outer membrane protein TolC